MWSHVRQNFAYLGHILSLSWLGGHSGNLNATRCPNVVDSPGALFNKRRRKEAPPILQSADYVKENPQDAAAQWL